MRFLLNLLLVSSLGLLLTLSPAQAKEDEKPYKIIVPFGAGGVADLSTRIVAEQLAIKLGQAVIVENRPGAGSIAASEVVANSAPDGHTLLLMSNSNAISASLFKKLPYNTVQDFSPISTIGSFDIGIVVDNDSPFKTLQELIVYSKANPGKMNLGTISIGSTQNLTGELFKSQAKLDIQIIPFTSTPQIITALKGKQVDAAIEILSPIASQIKSKNIRVLATTGSKRSNFFPTIPMVQEQGVPQFSSASWNGLAAPSKTKPQVIQTINLALVESLNMPGVKVRLEELLITPDPSSPEEMRNLLAQEIKRWSGIIDKAHITKQ
jgi:tripartite-type tricarboxylate transporter receptor subunit TctC